MTASGQVERAYPLFVLAEILMKKLSGIVGKIYE